MHVPNCRFQLALLGSVMRGSCRLSISQEHKLVKKAEPDAAAAAAAEAAVERISAYPSSVTKAIAGLACCPAHSCFQMTGVWLRSCFTMDR